MKWQKLSVLLTFPDNKPEGIFTLVFAVTTWVHCICMWISRWPQWIGKVRMRTRLSPWLSSRSEYDFCFKSVDAPLLSSFLPFTPSFPTESFWMEAKFRFCVTTRDSAPCPSFYRLSFDALRQLPFSVFRFVRYGFLMLNMDNEHFLILLELHFKLVNLVLVIMGFAEVSP